MGEFNDFLIIFYIFICFSKKYCIFAKKTKKYNKYRPLSIIGVIFVLSMVTIQKVEGLQR